MRHTRIARFASILAFTCAARAHNGPPFPIVQNQRVGPCVIALWTHPDVGTGTFWIMVDPPPGGAVPKDLKVEIGVQPVSGRLPEKRYAARLDSMRGQFQYYVEVPFDAQELWRIHLLLDSNTGHGRRPRRWRLRLRDSGGGTFSGTPRRSPPWLSCGFAPC